MLKMSRSIHAVLFTEHSVRASLAIKPILLASWEKAKINDTPYQIFTMSRQTQVDTKHTHTKRDTHMPGSLLKVGHTHCHTKSLEPIN